MKFAIAHTFSAPRERVFASLLDPEILKRCIDGCEQMVRTGEDAYDVQLKVGIAAMKGSYTGKVRITGKLPPESMTLMMEGKGGPGFMRSTSNLRLEERGGKTELSGEADATIGGLIAAIGSRLIEAVAKKMMADFFTRLDAEITSRSS